MKTVEHKLSPEQIIKVNKMKHLNINPAYGGTIVLPHESEKFDSDTHAVVKAGGMEIKLTMAEAFKL